MDPSGEWRLSPAYDVTYAFHPSHKYLSQHQLSGNNKRTGITRDDLLTVAEGMNIKKSKEIIEQIRETIKKWPGFAAMAEIPENQSVSIGKTHFTDI